MKYVFLLFFYIHANQVFSQDNVFLIGKWKGILDQNYGAKNHSGYNLYYNNGGFIKGKPTHAILLEVNSVKSAVIAGFETKNLISRPNDYAKFSFEGIFKDGYLIYRGIRKIEESLILSAGYCYTFAKLKYSSDKQFDYLSGLWQGTLTGSYCADAWVTLRREKKKLPDSILSLTSSKVPIAPQIQISKNKKLEDAYSTREKLVIDTIETKYSEITLEIDDNAEYDKDTVNILLNGKLIAKDIELKSRPKIIRLQIEDKYNTLEIVAQNLGEIPPNTSYLKIIDADKQIGISTRSSILQTGTIVIHKK
jgi:hypothetical protein